MTVHRGVTYLRYYGEVDRDRAGDHQFHLRIEESSGDFMLAGSEGEFEMPWLRACCSCGWASGTRFTIDENARWDWSKHVNSAPTTEWECDDCGQTFSGSPYYSFPPSGCVTSDHDAEPRPHAGCTGGLCQRCAGELEPDSSTR